MKEIWSLTQRYTEEGDFSSYKRDGSLISGWWMLRLLSFFASKGMRMPVAGSPAIAFQNFTMFGIGLDVLAIWYALTTLYLLRQVRPFEEALATRYGVDITSARSL